MKKFAMSFNLPARITNSKSKKSFPQFEDPGGACKQHHS